MSILVHFLLTIAVRRRVEHFASKLRRRNSPFPSSFLSIPVVPRNARTRISIEKRARMFRGVRALRRWKAANSTFCGDRTLGSVEKEAFERLKNPISVRLGKTTRDDDERWYKADHVDHVYPSVTSILRQTMSPSNRFVLWRWKREKRKELGDAGLKKLHQDTLNRGVALHKVIN